MQELRSEVVGDRRVALVEHDDGRYGIALAVHGPQGLWEEISLRADQDLLFHVASRRYHERVAEQQLRMRMLV